MEYTRGRCAVETTLKAIGGRWKILIIHELFSGVKRFSELQRSLESITQKMLTQQLRELEGHGVINRKVYPQVPPKVEYSLTSIGYDLLPVLDAMHQWGAKVGEIDPGHNPSAFIQDEVLEKIVN